MSESDGWLVVMTKPRMENEAKEQLLRQGFAVYLPLWMDLKRRANGWQQVQSPMFPRYLFIKATYAEQSFAPIRSTRGVAQMVRFGLEPAKASEQLIKDIRALEASRHSQSSTLKPFKKGDKVLVLDGPFKGTNAEVFACDQQRVILLLQLLGKTHQIDLDSRVCQVQ